jgi:RsiW-degrading membrane proteinase PrsW (M82 family)
MGLGTATAPALESNAPLWRRMWGAIRDSRLTKLNRLSFWFSIVMVVVTLQRTAGADWGNFRQLGGYQLFVVAWLIAVTYSVRTIGSREIIRYWLMGFFPVALVAYYISELFESLLGNTNLQFGVAVPILEETLKFAPIVLWTTAQRPKHLHGTLSDFLVLGFAIGAGFSFQEDALYVRVASSGFDDGFLGNLFPVFLSTDQFAITHAGWTALTGVGVGLISLYWRRPWARIVGLLLILAPIVDHAAVNWSGAGLSFMQSVTRDGRGAAWLLAFTVVGVVLHDFAGLGWSTKRDAFFPVPRVSGDLKAVSVGTAPQRLKELLTRQRYRRRRNAAFIDLFSVRSRGVSAGDRSRIMAELEHMRTEPVTAKPAFQPSSPSDETQPTPSAPAPLAASRSRQHAKPKTVVAFIAITAAVAVVLLWQSNGSDGDDIANVPATQASSTDSLPAVDDAPSNFPSSETSPTDPAQVVAEFGPVIAEPLLLRWESEDEGGPGPSSQLVVDGDRELWIIGDTLRYQEGGRSVLCTGLGSNRIDCLAQPRTGSLALVAWSDVNLGALELPNTAIESRNIEGRDATCVFVPFSEDTSTLSCADNETQLQLLVESRDVTIAGADSYFRQQLVEWSTPSESDFDIPSAARQALGAS